MDLIGILLIFVTIVGITYLKKPLYLALALASVVTGLFFKIPVSEFFNIVFNSAIDSTTINLVLVIYFLSFLQQLMEEKQMLKKAELAMTRLLNNRRLSLAITPVLIGFLPAPGAVLMASSIIEGGCDGKLSDGDMAFLASWYRHVPESSLPTFTAVILAATVTGVPMSSFLLTMIPFIIVIIAVPYFIYLRKVPKETGMEPSESKAKDLCELLLALWPIILIIVLILGFSFDTLTATIVAAVALLILGKYDIKNRLLPTLKKSFNFMMLCSTFFAMIFKDVLGATGAVNRLPALFENLPIPLFLVFALIFFIGTIVGGIQTMVTMILPTAMTALPGVPTLMLMMGTGHLASQLSPTHICLTLAAEYFKVGLGDIFKRTIPVVIIVFMFTCLFYLGFGMIM